MEVFWVVGCGFGIVFLGGGVEGWREGAEGGAVQEEDDLVYGVGSVSVPGSRAGYRRKMICCFSCAITRSAVSVNVVHPAGPTMSAPNPIATARTHNVSPETNRHEISPEMSLPRIESHAAQYRASRSRRVGRQAHRVDTGLGAVIRCCSTGLRAVIRYCSTGLGAVLCAISVPDIAH
eukprot:3941184-Rhodomonas_salina.1